MEDQTHVKRVLTLLFFTSTLNFLTFGQDIKQSVYLLDQFEDGYIITGNGNNLNIKLNYNTLQEKMYFMKGNFKLAIDEKMTIDSVKIRNRLFLPFGNAFYEVLLNDETALFKQHRTKLNEVGMNIGYSQTSKTTSNNTINFTKSPYHKGKNDIPSGYELVYRSQFWTNNEGKLKSFTSAKQLYNIFPELKNDIKYQLKLNKTDFTNDADVLKIIEFINSLM